MKLEKFKIPASVRIFGFLLLTAFVLSEKAFADTTELFLEQVGGGGGVFNVDAGGTIERYISGMSAFPGRLRFKAGFHVDNGIGEFERIRLDIKKGSETVYTGSCYSIHAPSDRTPKCDLTINITSAVADADGGYTLRVTNNSGKRIKEFSIYKVGINPLMPDYKSTFTPDCPNSVKLDMEGTTLSLNKDASATRDIIGIQRKKGHIHLEAKWHTATLIPNVFVKLKIELLRPDGTVVKSGSYYSRHASLDKTPKLYLGYDLTQSDAAMRGNWKIKVTNESDEKIEGFNIEKGSDGNPYVDAFNSTYKAECK